MKKYEYVNIEGNLELPSIELKNIKEFVRVAEATNSQLMFKTENRENADLSHFLFLFENKIFFKIKRKGYKDIGDYLDAEEKEFPTAEEYYDARKGNFMSYKEYNDCKKTGISDRTFYIRAQKAGFVDNFDKFIEKANKDKKLLPVQFDINQYNNPVKLYQYAIDKGFKEYYDFQEAIFLGFTDKILFDEAKSKGFTYAEDYLNAVKTGFDLANEYYEAKHLNIENKHEYDIYDKLNRASKNQLGKVQFCYDEVELFEELKKLENGKKVSLNKLSEMIDEIIEKNKIKTDKDGNKMLPEWYKRKLKTKKEIIEFLTETEEISAYGFFDAEGEYFEIFRVSPKIIYIDGSNVAFASMDKREGFKPMYKNLLLVAKKLKNLRYTKIKVIADASLRHKVSDPQNLQLLKNEVEYLEAPAQSTADEFLIQSAKNDKSFIVTNDTFKEWKIKETWVAENIDRIRIPFMIIGEKVSLPSLEQKMTE